MLAEIYIEQDESSCKTMRLSENPIIFRYEELFREEIDSLAYLLHNNKSRKQKSAGFSNKPAADFGARTGIQNHIQGGDILQDV